MEVVTESTYQCIMMFNLVTANAYLVTTTLRIDNVVIELSINWSP
jgi:hypothetical protein